MCLNFSIMFEIKIGDEAYIHTYKTFIWRPSKKIIAHNKKIYVKKEKAKLERFSVFMVFGLAGLCGWQ